MLARSHKTVDPEQQKTTRESQAGTANEENCRCKKVSEMKPGDLLRLMMSDLAFWKRPKKDKDGR